MDDKKQAKKLANKKWRETHKEYIKEYNKKWREKNKEYKIKIDKEYNNKHKKEMLEYMKKYNKKRKQEDKLFKLKHNIRNVMYYSFIKKNYYKENHTKEILGCDINEFANYLLETYKNNYGIEWDGIEKVHIDHIIPLAIAKTQEEIIKLCHYSNLQLLKAKDNLIKGSKIL